MAYEKTIWKAKDLITRTRMQKIEDELERLSNSSSGTIDREYIQQIIDESNPFYEIKIGHDNFTDSDYFISSTNYTEIKNKIEQEKIPYIKLYNIEYETDENEETITVAKINALAYFNSIDFDTDGKPIMFYTIPAHYPSSTSYSQLKITIYSDNSIIINSLPGLS